MACLRLRQNQGHLGQQSTEGQQQSPPQRTYKVLCLTPVPAVTLQIPSDLHFWRQYLHKNFPDDGVGSKSRQDMEQRHRVGQVDSFPPSFSPFLLACLSFSFSFFLFFQDGNKVSFSIKSPMHKKRNPQCTVAERGGQEEEGKGEGSLLSQSSLLCQALASFSALVRGDLCFLLASKYSLLSSILLFGACQAPTTEAFQPRVPSPWLCLGRLISSVKARLYEECILSLRRQQNRLAHE